MKTSFDEYLEEQLKDPAFAARFEAAWEAWDVAMQVAEQPVCYETGKGRRCRSSSSDEA
jgi:hypothetical protein